MCVKHKKITVTIPLPGKIDNISQKYVTVYEYFDINILNLKYTGLNNIIYVHINYIFVRVFLYIL